MTTTNPPVSSPPPARARTPQGEGSASARTLGESASATTPMEPSAEAMRAVLEAAPGGVPAVVHDDLLAYKQRVQEAIQEFLASHD